MAHQHHFNARQVLLAAAIMLAIVIMFFTAVSTLFAQSGAVVPVNPSLTSGITPDLQQAQQKLGNQQATFIENRGQWDNEAKFLLRSPGMDLWITNNGVVYDIYRIEHSNNARDKKEIGSRLASSVDANNSIAQKRSDLKVIRTPIFITYQGANSQASAIGNDKLQEYHNYFVGNDRSKWATNVPLYRSARVKGLYKGIDAVYYIDQGHPRYDLVVAAGADPASIRMKIEGALKVSVAPSGALRITTSLGTVEQRELFVYQNIDGKKQKVSCAFKTGTDGSVGLSIGSYDRSRPLIIDPIIYSKYIGGPYGDAISGIAVDGSGNVYLTGTEILLSSGSTFVSKLTSNGANSYSWSLNLSWIFFQSIAVDRTGTAYVTGSAASTYFPLRNAQDSTLGGSEDAIVMKLTSSGALSYSTFLGGSNNDRGDGIAVDTNGNVYVTGSTKSTDHPTLNAADTTLGGSQDAFITKLTSSGTLSYSTYLGGSNIDYGNSIAVDRRGAAYVTGSTASTNFPVERAQDSTLGGSEDAFVTKLISSGALSYSTYLGGSSDDKGNGIAVDSNSNVYVTGSTGSTNFPLLHAQDTTLGGSHDAFVTKLTLSGVLSYSTYLGGSNNEYGNGIAVDSVSNVYVTGSTGSTNFPTLKPQDATLGGNSDAFVTILSSAGTLSYSTYLGGSDMDLGTGIAVNRSYIMYVTGITSSTNFPVDTGSMFIGEHDGFITKLSTGATITSPSGGESWCPGSTHSITWETMEGGNFKIELSTDGGTTFATTIAASTPALTGSYTWTIPNGLTYNANWCIRICELSRGVGYDTSSLFTYNALTIHTNPANKIACVGSTASFSLSASPTITLQWQLSTNAGSSWSNISGATNSTYAITTTLAMNGYRYRTILTNSCENDTSSVAMLTVTDNYLTVSQQPQHDTTISGNQAQFQAAAASATFVNWQYSTDNGSSWNNLSWGDIGTNDSTITSGSTNSQSILFLNDTITWSISAGVMTTRFIFTSSRFENGYRFRALFKNLGPCIGTTSSAILTVNSPPIITTFPYSNSPVCSGTNVTFSAAATGATSTQWQLSTNSGSSWTDISGATTTSYTVVAPTYSMNGYRYRARFTNSYGSTHTPSAGLSLYPLSHPAVTDQPDNDVIVGGNSAFYGTSATNASSVQWQQSTNNGSTWSDLSGANSSSYDSTTLSGSTTIYWHTSSAGLTKWSFSGGVMTSSFRFTGTLSYNGRLYRAIFSNGYCTTNSTSASLTVKVRASDFGPAVVFISASNSGDAGRQIDIKVEILKNNTIICSGAIYNQSMTGTTQSGSRKITVPLSMIDGSEDFNVNDVLKVKVYGRCDDQTSIDWGISAGTKFWYNDSPNDTVNITLKGWSRLAKETQGGSSASYYYLRSSSVLNTSAGSSGASISKSLGTSWGLYDTWTMYGSSMKTAISAVTGATRGASVLPNPVYTGQAQLQLSLGKPGSARISIHDLLGNEVVQLPVVTIEHAGTMNIPLNISALASGIYTVRIETGNDLISTMLTVVE